MSFLPSKPKASLLDLFKAHPDLAKPLQEFTEAVMRGPSPFSERERELIAAYVSSLNGCECCRSAHTAVAERLGMPASMLDELLTDIDFADIPEKLKPVMRYVRKLNEAPSKVQRADAEAVLEAGWSETALVHAALICGHFNLMNRWVEGLGIAADPRAVRMAAQRLHKEGYRSTLNRLARHGRSAVSG